MTRKSIWLSWLLIVTCQGCSPPAVDSSPRNPVTESDVLGVWQLDYKGTLTRAGWLSGQETIILESDGKYRQSFDNGTGKNYPSNSNIWMLTRDYDGKQVVKLDSMRYFPNGVEQAFSNPPESYVFLKIQTNMKELFGKKGLILCFESEDLNRCFSRIPAEPANIKQDE